MLHSTAAASFALVAPEDLAGTTLAGYTLQARVGEGATAVVYRAAHSLHGIVAIKVLRARLRGDRTAVARFLREAEYATRVRHPNVVQTIEHCEARPGLHVIAIEWATGELLELHAKRRAPLGREETALIIGQIADAVDAAHQAGIIHRDLKPENVVYDAALKRVKLLDFGIAAQADHGDIRYTRPNFFVGTLMYVSPESLSGERVTVAADQYSLASIAYYLLSGCLPYLGRTQTDLYTQRLTKPPLPLGAAGSGARIDAGVEAVVMRGLERDPGARFGTVLAFSTALRDAIAAIAGHEGRATSGCSRSSSAHSR